MKKVLALALALLMMFAMAIPALAEEDPEATIYTSTVADPKNLDPALASDGESGVVIDRVFSGLMRYNPDGTVKPEIAESYTLSDDGLVYTFKIREGITFHDGTVCDAEAVKWNFERQMGEAATAEMPYAEAFYSTMVSCEAPDATTLIVTLSEPNSAFIVFTAQRIGMGIVSPTAFQADPVAFQRNPVGSGPYKMATWEPDQYIVLEANPDYILGAPKNKQVIVKVIKESAVRTSELLTGGIDTMNNISLDDVDRLKDAEGIVLNSRPGNNIGYMSFADYENNKLFSDKRLRDAIWYAIDRDALVAGLYGDNMVVANSVIPPTMQAGDQEYTTIPYDPEKAKELMSEAGYPEGFSFKLLTYNVTKGYNPAGERLAVALQSELAKVGITMEIEIQPWTEFLTAAYAETPDYDAIMSGWGAASNDTSYMLQLLDSKNIGTGSNHSGFVNAEFDELLKQAKQSTSYEEATKLYAQAAQLSNDENPWLLIGHGTEYTAYSDKLLAEGLYGLWGAQEDLIAKTK